VSSEERGKKKGQEEENVLFISVGKAERLGGRKRRRKRKGGGTGR